MKILIVDRTNCEVYFMPFEKKKPVRAEIHKYLLIHYPFFSASCRVYSHPCKICGLNFIIVTVFQAKGHTKKKSILNGYSSTISSLLSQSSYAKKNCEIVCENEHIKFGKNPESVYIGGGQYDIANSEAIHLTLEDLYNLAEKEHLKGYRYGSYLPYASILAFGAAALLLILPLIETFKKPESPPPISVSLINEIKSVPSFWETFSLETSAVIASGGVIQKYEYNRETVPTHRLNIQKCYPGFLYDELSKKDVFQEIVIPSAAYQKKEYAFEIVYSEAQPPEVLNDADSTNNRIDMYGDSREFNLFCIEKNIDLEGIIFKSIPVYSLKASEDNLSITCNALVQFCKNNNKNIGYLIIQRDDENRDLSITVSLTSTQTSSAYEFPEFTHLETAFGVHKKSGNTDDIKLALFGENRIGKIHGQDNACYVFSKSDSGNIQMEEERTYE